MIRSLPGVLALLVLAVPARAAEPETRGTVPLYRVTVEAGSVKAINYRPFSGPTKIGFRGTVFMPEGKGEATVKPEKGVMALDARFEKMEPASKFGSEYLTYVLWAVSPEGRASNLGEILLDGGKARLKTTTPMQAFGLIVTAEPYFAVTQVGNVVVFENVVLKKTKGNVEQIEAKYELLPRGQYTLNVSPADLKPMNIDKKVPIHLYQARNAVNIARWAGADAQARAAAEKDQLDAEALHEKEKAELREKLKAQLNVIMETRDTARGLIVNLSDLVFETGKHSLRPVMREKLAKVSGILLSQPGLKLEVEGPAS